MPAEARHVYEIYIRSTPQKVWEAITRFDLVKKYYYGHGLEGIIRKGESIRYLDPETKKPVIVGKILEVVRNRKFVHTFQFVYGRTPPESPSRVTYEISKWQGAVCLTLVHDRLEKSPETSKSVKGGWVPILSGLKTYLETGKPLWTNV